MTSSRSITITLTRDMAEVVRSRVASGDYASESDVVLAGLRALQARDADVEFWLREDVVASCRETAADPSIAIALHLALDRVKTRAHGNP